MKESHKLIHRIVGALSWPPCCVCGNEAKFRAISMWDDTLIKKSIVTLPFKYIQTEAFYCAAHRPKEIV